MGLTLMLIGAVNCGKSTLCRALQDMSPLEKKTQTIEVIGSCLDTPGEYLQNPRLNRALLVSAAQADVILLIQSSTAEENYFPAGFASMFYGKTVYGVISKIDLVNAEKDLDGAKDILRLAGVCKIFSVSALKGQGLAPLQKELRSAT